MEFILRFAERDDAPALVSIEADAAQLFRDVEGLDWIASNPGMGAAAYRQLIASGVVWVFEARLRAEAFLCGFLAARIEQADLHVVELSVRRKYQRRGLARRLLETAANEARRIGLKALVLTTFRDLAWNERLYLKLGFTTLKDEALGEYLLKQLDQDAAAGLPRQSRCAMRLDL